MGGAAITCCVPLLPLSFFVSFVIFAADDLVGQ